jgi:shikimate kinase
MPSIAAMAAASPSAGELAQRLQGLNLYLVGMMGAGKSAVGRPLAEALGYRFVDADSVIAQTAGRSIPEIFASDGETGFRDLETAVLDSIAHWHSLVVATGGGVVTRPRNWGHLQQGVVIWLDAPQELLLARLIADSTPRPLLAQADPAERLGALLAERRPLYGQADLSVEQLEEDSPSQIARKVLEALPAILRERRQAPEAAAQLLDSDGQPTAGLN